MAWLNHPRGAFNVVWHHPDGWRAVCCLTSVGQFGADLTHADGGDCFRYDSAFREQAHGHQYEQLSRDALEQFDAWIEQHGAEALDDLPVSLTVTRRQARALGQALPELIGKSSPDLELMAAFTRLRLALADGR